MHASGAGADHVLHQLEGIEHTTEACFGIRNDGQEVVNVFLAARLDPARPLDFIGTLEGVIDPTHHGWHRIIGIQRLIGVHGLAGIAVGGDLPAGQIHRFQTRLGLLHGLAGGDSAKCVDVALLGFAIDQLPQLFGTPTRQGVLDLQGAPKPYNVGSGVTTLDILPSGVFGPVLFQGLDLLLARHRHHFLQHEIRAGGRRQPGSENRRTHRR